MKHFLRVAAFLAAFACVSAADAAPCFWVGGVGTWSTANAASWSSSTGGAGSTCAATGGIPKQAGDTATFDGLSGGGTVTVDSTMNGTTLDTLVAGAFTGTLDFSVNNPSMTFGGNGVPGINISGAGTRTIKMGSGTFTLKTTSNNAWNSGTTTGLTYDTTSTATFNIAGNGASATQDFIPGSVVFTNNTLNIASRTDGAFANLSATTTFKALTFSTGGPAGLKIQSGSTLTITNALNINGSTSGLIQITQGNFGTKATIALTNPGTASWVAFYGIAATTSSLTATNSFDGGDNTGITITPPSVGGGGGRIIGG